LLDETASPTVEFGPLYHLRWGIETFYGRLKTRLGLENFSGTSPEAVKQDFFAPVFITGLESILTDTAQARLGGC
jgi:Transposase DDE domain